MAISIQQFKAMRSGNKPGAQPAKAKGRKKNPEYEIQAAYVAEMAARFPNLMVFSDTAAHIAKTLFQQIRANKLSTGVKWPDVFVAQPSGKYHGLYLEFKAESPFKQDGTLKKNDHVAEQAKCLTMLKDRGYFACFVWSVQDAMEITENYLRFEQAKETTYKA